MKLIVRFLINAVAIWLAAQLIEGVQLTENLAGIAIVVLVFAAVNALVRPIVKLLTLPINIMTLGLFTFIINAAMLLLTALLVGDYLALGATLGEQLVNALLGSLVISIVSTVLSWFLPD